ncbi:hypothetical protein Tco_1354890 [Tanacetum coccineum]
MIPGTDLHCFDVHNDSYFSHLPLTYVDGVILEMYLCQAITYDMDACVYKKIIPPKKRYCNDFSFDEMVDWAEMEVEKPDGAETRTSNIHKGTDATVKLEVTVNPDGKTYFDRFYVCFVGLTYGWKAWCRKVIALDGCFLKSPNQGEILTAIERDGKNHIYPVAWAVGLIEAVKDSMPNAEHRKYARHIYENFRKQYLGLEFKQLF